MEYSRGGREKGEARRRKRLGLTYIHIDIHIDRACAQKSPPNVASIYIHLPLCAARGSGGGDGDDVNFAVESEKDSLADRQRVFMHILYGILKSNRRM